MLNGQQIKTLDLIELAVTEAIKSLGDNWVELSFCNGSEVFDNDSNSETKEALKAA